MIGRVKVPAELFRMTPDGYQLRMAAPTLGQHNREVFVDGLGYSAAELSVMRQTGVI